MKSSVKFANSEMTFLANCLEFIAYKNFSSFNRKSLSHSYHNFAVLFFHKKIWQQFITNICQCISSKFKAIRRKLVFSKTLFFYPFINRASKFIVKPLKNIKIVVTYLKKSVIVGVRRSSRACYSVKKANKKAPFPIYKTCKIFDTWFQKFSFGLIDYNIKSNKVICPA